MKAAILGLVAVAASASSVAVADFVQLSQENPSYVDNYMRLRGGRELGKHKRQKAAEEELIHAMEAEESLVEAVETETALVQEFAKAEKRMKKEKKEKKEKRKKEKREKKVKKAGPVKGHGAPHAEQPKENRKNALKEGAPLVSEIMSKTSKPTDIGGTVSAPKGPGPEKPAHRERGESISSSPSTAMPSFNPTISPPSEQEVRIQVISESPSSANNDDEATSLPTFLPSFSPTGGEEYVEATATTSSPSSAVVPVTLSPSSVVTMLVESSTTATTTAFVSTVSVITPVPTADPATSAPSAINDVEAISILTSMPSYSPTGSPSTSSVETVPVNTTTTPIISTPTTLPPTLATTSDAPTTPAVEVVAATPTTPSPSSISVVVPTPTLNLTAVPAEDDASETVPDCPAAYDPTKTTYVGGDVTTVNEHIFECQSKFEKYCNIAAWDDALLTGDANARQSWDDAWMHISPCVAVTSDEV